MLLKGTWCPPGEQRGAFLAPLFLAATSAAQLTSLLLTVLTDTFLLSVLVVVVMVMIIVIQEVVMSEFVVKITDQHKRMLIESIDLKIASVKRARNSNKSPAFLELYEQELREYTALQSLIVSSK